MRFNTPAKALSLFDGFANITDDKRGEHAPALFTGRLGRASLVEEQQGTLDRLGGIGKKVQRLDVLGSLGDCAGKLPGKQL